ncbi:uncharacterized protein SPSK_06917 [Sporothrix schenckii 1099-18]|uniref:Uncharacterized protein n=1 Tax=Sporothrix schenckii 1099-18 TaxID=1397361 RepID=A0A0F2MDU5_SPOSC|nr:uncharacterized protein SPSK_06917 [Sporothrix schenckii 1099-18]KJR87817.1 hypothetical protein SPSK_06917 [Sporothrix schenckii 1099-18]
MPPAPHTATRATRSRFSSPLHSGVADAAAGSGSSIGRQVGSGSTPTSSTTAGSSNNGVTNAQRAMMARWLEPPVQSKSSFEEAGFQRHGVFEGMAPLGTLPKAVNVAKRISGLPEEKLFHEGSPLGRQTVKQQQKRKEQQGQQGRRAGQQGPDDDDDGEARRELPTVETDTQEQDSTGTQHQEHDEDSKPQERQPISTLNSKKIILKRPNAGKHVPTRIIVAPKRSTRSGPQSATSDVADREDAHQESGPNAPSTPITPTTPSTRRSIIFRPAPGNSKRQARASARQQEKQRRKSQEATDEAADDADQSDQETAGGPDAVLTADVDAGDQVHSNESAEVQSEKPALEKPKSAKRPVGRPKSRRSLAAEQRALKQKEAAEAEAERIVAAEAEAQIEAEAPPVLTPVTTAAPIRPENGQEADTEGDVRDSDGDSVGDSFDSQDEDNDGYGGKPSGFDSSFLPLNTPYGLQRPRSDSNATEVNREVTDKVVDLAVEEAVRHFRYPTAWALRTLYDEQAGNQTFLTMVEDVFQQTADREAINTFARMVHEKKKEGKKDNKGCKHFVPPGTDINIAAHKPIPAPYADLITMDLPQFTTDVSGNIIDSTTDDTAHARKRVKLTDEDSELVVTPPAPATVSMHTFAPPQPSVASDASHRETEQPASASKKSSAKVKTPLQSPRASKTPAALSASATPKTPTKTPRGRPGRPPGSKNKTLAEKAASAQKKQPVPKIEEDATMTTPPPFAQGIDAAPSTPPTIRRHLRADSVASSLSPALSISPPSKNARGLYVDGETISDKDNDVVMRDATGGAVTSIGWTAETVKRTTTKKDGVHESDMAKSRTHEDDSKESSVSQSKRGGGGADRRRGGPGSGRGGRRRGAGRPPKNRTLTGAGLSAPKASTTTQPPEPTPTPAPAPETALQPIATRNRSSAKKSPTPLPALISPLSSSSQPQSQTQTHTTGSQHSHHQQPKRTSAAAAAAAISASAKDEMPAAVEDHISVRPVSVAKRAQNGNGKSRNSTAALPSPAMNSTDAAPNSLGKSESDEAGEERLARLRREARGVTNSIGVAPESFTRGSATLLSTGAASSSRPTSASRSRRGSVPDAASHQPLLETPQPQRQRQLRASTTATRTTRSARKRAFDEVDEDLSPRSGSFPSDDLPSTRLQTPVPAQQVAAVNGSNGNSRAGTPGPKSKKPRVGLRVKSS